MSELVRYRPGDAIRWLDLGSDSLRDQAARQTRDVMERRGERTITKDLGGLLGAALNYSRGAMADMKHKQAEASEYVLDGEGFEIRTGRTLRRVLYKEVRAMRRDGDRVKVILTQGSIEIKPYAHIVSGRIRVPVGWARNDIEVPYDLLLEELAARANLQIDEID
ncbi:MAG: hypothetical protein JNJ45_12395 [Chthonomonas sp.]|nr:hypothetical protein [Chthonomonas sp.]